MNLLKLLIFSTILLTMSCNPNKEVGEQEAFEDQKVKNVVLKTNQNGQYRLFVDNEEFYINGAGLEFGNKKTLAEHGGNAFRTWRINNGKQSGQEVLDEALRNGLMVFMGIDVGRERHGFNYDNEDEVKRQLNDIKKKILTYKDHPALLGWGIGNELNLHYKNKRVWNAVNDISKMIHEVDGNHPTTTMLAGIGKDDISYIKEHCSDLDFISIQMYADIINLQERIKEAEYDGPYMITEWGATGHWEVGRTEWGAPIEQTSSEKAYSVKERYEVAINSDSSRCIGSFIFLWGQKHERTPTWYGLFTENNEETEAIDVMHYFWNTNQWPENRVPEVVNVRLNGKSRSDNIYVNGSDKIALSYEATDPDGDELKWRFEILEESTDLKEGGDFEERPESIKNHVVSESIGNIVFEAPNKTGAYRAFIYVLDGNNNAATANIPFYVNSQN